jgi:single-strand DNA-binding protein
MTIMSEMRMPDVNTVIIAGSLTREPSFRKTTNGTPVANFWIASSRKFKDNTGQWRENVCYVGVVAWYKLAETCSENLQKGSSVLVEGELQSRSLRGEDGRNRNIVEIKASRIQFLNRRDEAATETVEATPTETEDPSPQAAREKPNPPVEEAETKNPLKGKFDFGYQELEM